MHCLCDHTCALQPLPDADTVNKSIDERSLYAAPFPFDATLDAVQDMFAKNGPVNCVRFRRHLASKDFKGSVFVEFTSKEAAEEVCTGSFHTLCLCNTSCFVAGPGQVTGV